MRKYLIASTSNSYKANLHCHSTFSDGSLTVEQIKDAYKKEGYSIVAFTDHDILLAHPELNDDEFLALNGFEYEIDEPHPAGTEHRYLHTCHICFIALEQNNITQFCFNERYLFGNAVKYADKVKYDNETCGYIRSYDPKEISNLMKIGREKGFFVTYNHPVWSLEEYKQYINYHGMHAMEIVNNSCITLGHEEYNAKIYDDILNNGEMIYAVASDDNHNFHPFGSPKCDSFGGFVMIQADKLHYETITKALVDGNFYASQGPIIKELYVEGEYAYIKTSPARKIVLSTDNRHMSSEYGVNITEAKLRIGGGNKYFRITVIDSEGKHANTRAYLITDLQ
jgi:hypothetical protein